MQKRLISYALLAASAASAAIVEDVRAAIARNDFAAGESEIAAYKARNGITPEMILALSWLGRGALAAKNHERAETYAKETYRLATAELARRQLDADTLLPLALGAAIEVEGQCLAARGERDNAVAYLRGQLDRFYATSIRTRIQKNINLLSLEGKPAPAIEVASFAGARPKTLAALKGKPVLLFFWAHWCGDCKTMFPHLARLQQEFAGRFELLGVTQHYGYVAQGEEAPRDVETRYIAEVKQKYYARLSMPSAISENAFKVYGSSTSPTLVFIDPRGVVRLYRPGKMTYDELRAGLEKVLPRT